MKYYVYQHIREDKNEVFYIGIGTKSNQDLKCNTYSRAYSKHLDNNIWLKIVAKTKWRYEILFEFDTREEVQNKEIELIAKYGRKYDSSGNLVNLTLGGESNLGYKHTNETKLKISLAQTGKVGRRLGSKLTDEQKIKFSIIQTEVANRPEMIELRRNIAKGNTYHLGKLHSEDSKKKMSESAKKRGLNCVTTKCELIDIINNLNWKANSIADLARISPLSLSTLGRMSIGIKVSDKTNKQYKFKKLENNEQNTI